MKVELKEISDVNRAECIALRVTASQAQYIASNEDSLTEAADNPNIARPFLILADGKAVGFTMFAVDDENDDPDDRYWLWRFMIDHSFQGKGFGRAALYEIIEYFRMNGANTITLSTKESNTTALSLYHSLGFLENGQMNDDEIVLKLRLN